MNDRTLQDILRRLQRLEQTSVRYRAGEVTDVGPLDVALGGSSVSYEDVQSIGPVANGDQVATLLWGNDLLVLGALSRGMRFGTTPVSTAAAVSGSATVTHGLGATPSCVVATDGSDANGITNATVASVGATQFTLAIRFTDGTPRTTTHDVYWLAIG